MNIKVIENIICKIIKISTLFVLGIALYSLIRQSIYHDSFFSFITWLFLISTSLILCRCNLPGGAYKNSVIIFSAAALVRVLFCIIWNVLPSNDFLSTYRTASQMALSPLSEWNNILGITYADNCPYIVPYIIYESIIIKIFSDKSIFALQMINIMASSATCVLLYKIGTHIFGETSGRLAAWFYLWNPTVLFFISVLTCQHIALFFLLLGIYIIIRQPYRKPVVNLIAAALAEAMSNLFRPEVIVLNIALLCVAVIYVLKSDLKKLIKSFIGYFIIYMTTLVAINLLLLGGGIVNKSILKSNVAYKLLVGLNYEHHGTWNEEDGIMLLEEDEEIWKLVKERLKDPIKIGELIKEKIYITYGEYTNYAFFNDWGEEESKTFFQEYILSSMCNGYMLIIIFLAFIKCLKMKTDMSLQEYIIVISMLGFCLIFTLIETSNRYSYVIVPFFTLLAGSAWIDLNRDIVEKNMFDHI